MAQIPAYEIIRRDRNRRGGGVAFLVKNNYSYTLRDDLISRDLEAICIELTLRMSRPVLILTWYRPLDWNAKVFDLFEEFLQKAEAEHKELIILGYLNCDLYTNTARSTTKKLVELLDVYQKPYVPQATLQVMYKSFVLPYFNYCSTIWYDGNKMQAEKMLKLHGLLPVRA